MRGSSHLRKRLKKYKWSLMKLPGVVYLFIYNYVPMYGVILAFKTIIMSMA